jgi:mycothiol synthase
MNIDEIKLDDVSLPADLHLRSAQWSDAPAIADLILAASIADGDPTATVTVADLNRFWSSPDVKIATDVWVVETQEGLIVGYEEFYNKHAHLAMVGDGYVHPAFHGLGIGTSMLHTLEQRARKEMELAQPNLRAYLRNGVVATDTAACKLHENEGYKAIRHSWHMEIELKEAPQVPALPAGLELRPFHLEEHNHAVYESHEEAFSDHWGHVPGTFDLWNHFHVAEREDFDPSLWFIAWDRHSEQIAGYSICNFRGGTGWVGILGVRRPWRKRGLGEALLLHSFGEFYKRGTKTIGLGVDAQNPTGATHLYQKVGMHVASEAVIYEKELRSGRSISDE